RVIQALLAPTPGATANASARPTSYAHRPPSVPTLRSISMSPSWSTTRAVASSLGAALIAGLGSAITYYVVRNRTYWIHDRRAASAAGFIERTAWVDGAALHYAEGPDNGPPLL